MLRFVRSTCASLLVALLLVLGCGGDAPMPHREPVHLDTHLGNFASGVIDAICGAVADGFLDGDGLWLRNEVALHARHGLTCREVVLINSYARGGPIPSDPRILETFGLGLLRWPLGYEDAYDAARVESELAYDTVAADECFAEIRARGVARDDLNLIPACRRAFDGQVPLGHTCSTDGECAGDAYCAPVIEADQTCSHSVCTLRGTEGMPCSPDEDGCTTGSEAGEARCASGCTVERLVTNLGVGEPCARTEGEVRLCGVGLACFHPHGATEPVCTAPVALGGDCTSGRAGEAEFAPCVPGARCISRGAESTCVAARLATRVGAGCGYPSAPSAQCDAFARLECGTDGTCASIGDGKVGAPCRGALSEFDCNAGLRCAVADGDVGSCQSVIQPIGALHDPCALGVDWTETCEAGLRCAATATGTPTCESLPFASGIRCSSATDCAAGLTCRAIEVYPPAYPAPQTYACLAPSSDGMGCERDSDCASGVCPYGYVRTCSSRQLGSQCSDAADCLSGFCSYGACAQVVAIGEPCDQASLCPDGTFCSHDSPRVCTAPRADGSSCSGPTECASRRCDPASATCQPAKGLGETCTQDTHECGPNVCSDSLASPGVFACAAPPLANGGGCQADEECASGICGYVSSLQGSYCRDPGVVGSECHERDDCLTERCLSDSPGEIPTCREAMPDRANCQTDAQCASGVCRAPPNTYAAWFDSRCGDWADICFDGAYAHGW